MDIFILWNEVIFSVYFLGNVIEPEFTEKVYDKFESLFLTFLFVMVSNFL